MRVISGEKGHLKLIAPVGKNTRPTTDRIKETLFNIIQNDIKDCMFLDLFAGSGQIGIEALSRGAKVSYFVENDREAINVIEKNLMTTKLTLKAKVLNQNVFSALNKLNGKVFDIVFMDPPYDKHIEKDVLDLLLSNNIIDSTSLVIIEASKDFNMDLIDSNNYSIIKTKIYKTNQHVFLQKKEKKAKL